MGKEKGRDRVARLVKVEHLLYQTPAGLTVKEIAGKCQVSARTTYRDLDALQCEIGVPIWEEGTRRGVSDSHYLPPVRLTLPEALNIFLAARLMLGYSHRYDPNATSIFMKLNSIVPPPLREQVQKTLDWMQKQRKDERYLRILAKLAEAWVSQRCANIIYRSLEAERATERVIEPYFIEPAAAGHSSYVIAYCHRAGAVRVFKIERIEGIEMMPKIYAIPADFDANEYFGSSWGVVVEGEVKTVRLKFVPDLARIMEETVWHPSQVVERQKDGSVIVTLKVMDTIELHS